MITLESNGDLKFSENVHFQGLTQKGQTSLTEKVNFEEEVKFDGVVNLTGTVFEKGLKFTSPASIINELSEDIMSLLCPAGVILPYGGSTAPPGFLLCDGQPYKTSDYIELFTIVGNGNEDGTNFTVPDLRGYFLCGADDSEGDVGKTLVDDNIQHSHNEPNHDHVIEYYPSPNSSLHGGTNSFGLTATTEYTKNQAYKYCGTGRKPEEKSPTTYTWTSGWEASMTKTEVILGESGNAEARPINAYVNFIIKT